MKKYLKIFILSIVFIGLGMFDYILQTNFYKERLGSESLGKYLFFIILFLCLTVETACFYFWGKYFEEKIFWKKYLVRYTLLVFMIALIFISGFSTFVDQVHRERTVELDYEYKNKKGELKKQTAKSREEEYNDKKKRLQEQLKSITRQENANHNMLSELNSKKDKWLKLKIKKDNEKTLKEKRKLVKELNNLKKNDQNQILVKKETTHLKSLEDKTGWNATILSILFQIIMSYIIEFGKIFFSFLLAQSLGMKKKIKDNSMRNPDKPIKKAIELKKYLNGNLNISKNDFESLFDGLETIIYFFQDNTVYIINSKYFTLYIPAWETLSKVYYEENIEDEEIESIQIKIEKLISNTKPEWIGVCFIDCSILGYERSILIAKDIVVLIEQIFLKNKLKGVVNYAN